MYMKHELFDKQTNIDEEKKGKPEGFFAPSELHATRLQDAVKLIARMNNVKSVLDVGCGYADMYPLIDELFPGVKYVGIDTVEWVAEEAAIRRQGNPNVEIYNCDLAEFAYDEPFDVVLCLGVLAMVDKGMAPLLVRDMMVYTKKAIIVEWHDSKHYSGKFISHTPDEMAALFLHPVVKANTIVRENESSRTTLIEI